MMNTQNSFDCCLTVKCPTGGTSSNAVVNIVKNNHIKGSDNVPLEFARIGLVGNQPNQPKAIPIFYKNKDGTMLHHNVEGLPEDQNLQHCGKQLPSTKPIIMRLKR